MRTKIILAFTFLLSIIPSSLFAFCYEEAGEGYDINPVLLRTISKTESNLNPIAVNTNPNGTQDIGLMQINSFWVKSLNLDYSLLLSDPCYNVKTGANILKKCFDRYGYTWEAIGCYNATSKHKRIEYSWKIFNKLKEGSAGQGDKGSRGHPVKASPLLKSLNPRILESTNSSFSFTVRDKIQ